MSTMTREEREALLPEMPEPHGVTISPAVDGKQEFRLIGRASDLKQSIHTDAGLRAYALTAADARETAVLDRLARAPRPYVEGTPRDPSMILIEMPDGSFAEKKFEHLLPDDRVVFDGPGANGSLDKIQENLEAEIEMAGGLEQWRRASVGRFQTQVIEE